MIEVHKAHTKPRCQAMTVADIYGGQYSLQCEDMAEHIGSHMAALRKDEIWVWPSEFDIREAEFTAQQDALSDEQIMLQLTGGDPEKRAEVEQWAKGTAQFVQFGLKMRAEIDTLKEQLAQAKLQLDDIGKGWREDILQKGQAWQDLEDVRKLLAKEREYAKEMIKDYDKQIERYEAVEKDHTRTRADLYTVLQTAIEMRKGHEGCVTDPACGSCFRCDFDKAVDAWLKENP